MNLLDTAPFGKLPDELKDRAMQLLEPVLALVAGHIVPARARQDAQWGGPAHDDTHRPDDWMSYIGKQMHKVQTARDPDATRLALVQIAALAIAAIQSHDRLHVPVAEECDCPVCTLERSMSTFAQSYGRAPPRTAVKDFETVSSPEEFLHVVILSRLGLGGRPR